VSVAYMSVREFVMPLVWHPNRVKAALRAL
jgi:hypothetical protein